MAFRDHPFPADTPPFPSHKQIVQYLQATVKKRNLEPHISFSTLVRAVYFTPGSDDPASKWTVATSKTVDGERVDSSETFSHVGEPCDTRELVPQS
jgi:cation diffusion facilitator CzcD-associated flavoprotein CzcO